MIISIFMNILPSIKNNHISNYKNTYPMQNINKLIPYEINNNNTVENFILDNELSPYIFYLILNNCCRCIMNFHNIYNFYHSNTTINNFYINDNYDCSLVYNIKNKNELTKNNNYLDYELFFTNLYTKLLFKNKALINIFKLYNNTLIMNIFPYR